MAIEWIELIFDFILLNILSPHWESGLSDWQIRTLSRLWGNEGRIDEWTKRSCLVDSILELHLLCCRALIVFDLWTISSSLNIEAWENMINVLHRYDLRRLHKINIWKNIDGNIKWYVIMKLMKWHKKEI